jgi:transposase
MKLFVGIDISSKKLDVCFLDSEDTRLFEASLSNDVNGAAQIKDRILRYHESYCYDKIVIGMESTSIYSFHPSMFLHEDTELRDLKIVEVVVENPRNIHRYSNVWDEDKTDKIDAFRIADYMRIGRYKNCIIREEKYQALQRLTRSRYQIVCQMTECKQHFLENLYYKCNTISKEFNDDNKSVLGATMMDILSDNLSLDEFANMEIEKLAELLQEKGRNKFSDPEKLAKTIQKAIRDSYRLGKVMQNSVDVVLATYVEIIKSLKKQIKALEKSIEALFETIPESECLKSIPGVSTVYTAGIIAEIGQIERFEDETKLAKYAGLHWKKKESGDFKSQRTPMTYAGNHYLRYYLVEAANSVRMREETYRDYYKKKYAEVPKYAHKRALVLTARKFVRLVDVLLRNRQLYTPGRSV